MYRAFEAYKGDSWLAPYLKRYWKVLALAVLLSVLAYVFACALMFTSGYMISLAATLPFTVLALHVPSIFVRIFGIGKPILQYFERISSHDWVLRATSHLRKRVYDSVERQAGRRSLGEALGLFATDIEHVQDICLRSVLPLSACVIVYVIAVALSGAFSPALGLVTLLVLGCVCIVMPLWSIAANGADIEARRHEEKSAYDQLVDDVAGIADWSLSGRREEFLKRWTSGYDRLYEQGRKVAARQRRGTLVRQVLYAAFIVAVILWSCVSFGAAGSAGPYICTGLVDALSDVQMHDSVAYAPNWIAAFVLCAFPLIEVFSQAEPAMLGLAANSHAIEDLNGLDGSEETHEGAECPNKCKAPSNPSNAIEAEGVSFCYAPGECMVLDGVNLDVAKGEKVAILGRSGSGKSTLLGLLEGRLSPSRGHVAVDGKVGSIEQFPYVFNKTLRENMLVACPDATDEEIGGALHAVGLGGLLERLPEGLDETMAEGGETVSGGERHRIAIARILLYDCDIVLLDEPYLGLDRQTEKEVSATMLDALSDRTVLLVTHHSHGLEGFDRVVEMGGASSEATPNTPSF